MNVLREFQQFVKKISKLKVGHPATSEEKIKPAVRTPRGETQKENPLCRNTGTETLGGV